VGDRHCAPEQDVERFDTRFDIPRSVIELATAQEASGIPRDQDVERF